MPATLRRVAETDPQPYPVWVPPVALAGSAIAVLNLPAPVVFLMAVAVIVAAGLTIADMRAEPGAPDIGSTPED